jgi:hypothetical protein
MPFQIENVIKDHDRKQTPWSPKPDTRKILLRASSSIHGAHDVEGILHRFIRCSLRGLLRGSRKSNTSYRRTT